VAVLELLAAHPDERFTLSEVARRCMLNKATAHALLNALSERGVLLRHPTEKRYSLGPRLILVGEAARRGYTATDFAPPIVTGLAATTGLWARAWQVRGDQLVCVAQAGAPAGSAHAAVGMPLAPPLGAAVIASSDEPTREAWLARAAVGDAVSPALDALAAVREWGYAATLASDEWWALAGVWRAAAGDGQEGDGTDGADGRALLSAIGRQHLLVTRLDDGASYRLAEVSAPVFDVSGQAVLMLSVTCVPGVVVPTSDVRALGRRVVAAADGLTAATCGQRSAGGGHGRRVVQAVGPAAGNEAV
jgi:DNA-binding IclR family transcriptional regulator